jgi:hypothetical protein
MARSLARAGSRSLPSTRAGLLLCSVALLAGCGESARADTAPSASAAPKPVSARQACTRVCERAAKCGLEQAEKIAASGSADDAKLVGDAKDRAVATEARCVDACSPSAEATPDAAGRMLSCLDQARCDTFAACIERVGGDPG